MPSRNSTYDIQTYQEGDAVDTVLDVYEQLGDGTLTNIIHANLEGAGSNIVESVQLTNADGMYYVRVSPADTNSWGAKSGYWIIILVELTGRPRQPGGSRRG